jgi:hypothetical protein
MNTHSNESDAQIRVEDLTAGLEPTPQIESRPTAPSLPAPAPQSALTASPKPASLPAPTPARVSTHGTPPVRPPSNPRLWGRIGDDGTAFLTTADGDRIVGQWAAGTAEEGLAYFGRKYDDLVVEVDLARFRLVEGRSSAEQAATVTKNVRTAVAEPTCIGDISSLLSLCDELEALIEERRVAERERRLEQKQQARQLREKLVEEAEGLATSTSWKSTRDRYAAILEEWKAAPRVDRAVEQKLWKRFSAARSAFDKARRAHFTRRETDRKEAVATKEALIKEATSLQESQDWAGTTREYRRLMDKWKAAGHAGRNVEDALWQRFRAAQDVFFAARDAAQSEKDSEEKANLAQKIALVEEAERLLPITDAAVAKKSLRTIGEKWESIGHVPRNERDRVEGRLRRVEEAIRKIEQDQWKRSNPESRARAEDTTAKFEEALQRAEKARDEARARGDEKAALAAEATIEQMSGLLEAARSALEEFSR